MYNHSELIHNTKAAKVVLPIIIELFSPKSILDVGTGVGTWLGVAKELGVNQVLGIDCDFVDKNHRNRYLMDDEFLAFDLNNPFELNRKFDLAFCLEVAEHLPDSSSDNLIYSLVSHADIIIFSAAIPGQGGQNHINEQWPEYWQQKFHKFGYHAYDPIRPLIWSDIRVDPWYRQNILVFSNQDYYLPELLFDKVVLPEFFEDLLNRNRLLNNQIQNILEGEKSPLFYLKRFLISIFKFRAR